MKRLFLTPLIVLLLAFGVWAQPVNKTYELVADTLSDTQNVSRSDVQDLEVSFPEGGCLHEVLNGETRYYYLVTVAPGFHSYRVRVFYNERTVTNPDGSTTVYPAAWSGWSNTVEGTKLQTLDLSVLDGYLVTPMQAGVVSTNVYIDDMTYIGLNEPSPDRQFLRIYNISSFSQGTYNIWANAVSLDSNGSLWEGDYKTDPFVVTIAPTPQAPVNLRIQAQ